MYIALGATRRVDVSSSSNDVVSRTLPVCEFRLFLLAKILRRVVHEAVFLVYHGATPTDKWTYPTCLFARKVNEMPHAYFRGTGAEFRHGKMFLWGCGIAWSPT